MQFVEWPGSQDPAFCAFDPHAIVGRIRYWKPRSKKCVGRCLEIRTAQRPGMGLCDSCQFRPLLAILNKRVLRCYRAICWLWQGRSQYLTLVKPKYSALHTASHALAISAIQALLGRVRRKGTLLPPPLKLLHSEQGIGIESPVQKIKLACSSVLP